MSTLGWISIVRIFLRTEEGHIFTEKQIYHNKIKYSAHDLAVHPKICFVRSKTCLSKFTALFKEGLLPTVDLVMVCDQN